MSEPDASPTRPKHRSPSYPAIDLASALKRTEQMYGATGRHSAPVAAVAQAWGYSAKSSGGRLALAALKKFGLIEDEGSKDARQVKLSTLGHELVFYKDQRDGPEWQQRAQQAALLPTIHRELWAKYDGDFPNDQVITHYLVFERAFSESAAAELLAEFRSTITFSGLADKASTAPDDDEDSDEDAGGIVTPATLTEPETGRKNRPPPANPPGPQEPRTVQVPYSPTGWALVQAPFPMTGAEWDQMIAVLNAMKPGLVTPDTSQ